MLSENAFRRLGQAYAAAGHQLYAVGGCVRDLLLGRPTSDYDFTTDALPETVSGCWPRLRPEALYNVGEKFGTIGAVLEGHRVEVTTFRGEHYTAEGKRHPTVTFGVGLRDDLARRDFTINAMALDVTVASQPSSALAQPRRQPGRMELPRWPTPLAAGTTCGPRWSAPWATPSSASPKTPCGCCARCASPPSSTSPSSGRPRRPSPPRQPRLADISTERIAEEMNKSCWPTGPRAGSACWSTWA